MTLKQVRDANKRRLNNFRTLGRIISSPEFEECYRFRDDQLLSALDRGDVDSVKHWMREVMKRELCEFTISELRRVAGELGIRNYTQYTKDELLIEIIQVKHAESKQVEDVAIRVSCVQQSVETVHS